ncbi:MAG: FGGY-family carbohydrate kinase [Eubacterium sp.]|nr:FGGY-family carbohydrate kinase [Eubacterium sp.]
MYIIIYDFGTSSVKTCLFEIDSEIKLLAKSVKEYGLYVSDDGGAEQDTEEWWEAICSSTKDLFDLSDVKPEQIEGLAFCSQMQGTVLVDKEGNALRPPMNFLDQRGVKEHKACMGKGLIKVSGYSLYKVLRNLRVNCGGSVSIKDPVWKYKWVENNEPEIFDKLYKWLDVGDYLVARLTGKIVRTPDTAFTTFLYDTRKGKEGWNKGLIKMYKVKPEHMPDIIECTDLVGGLTAKAAEDLGLVEGIPVFGGGGDATFVNIGAGSTALGDTHIYIGTSGWVSTVMDHQTADLSSMITGLLSAQKGYFNYFAELETAGKCVDWALEHIALDDVGVYEGKAKVTDSDGNEIDIFDYLEAETDKVPPGANGVIFTPWLHGNRSPFEDSKAGGMYFNFSINNEKRDLLRATLEGICYHYRWMLERSMKKTKTSDTIRFVGGGALSSVLCQMLADITGRTIETVDNPREVGATGTAVMVAAGIKKVDMLKLSKQLVKANHTYVPNAENKEAYDKNYKVFKRLYKTNKSNFHIINS